MRVYLFHSGAFCTDYRNSCAHDVVFRDIQLLCDEGVPAPTPTFLGVDDEHAIWDISIENMTVNGKKVDTLEKAHVVANEFARNITIK